MVKIRRICAEKTDVKKYAYFNLRCLMALISTIKVEIVVRQPNKEKRGCEI